MYTFGNSTWSVTTLRRSEVMAGVTAVIFGTSGPIGIDPKYQHRLFGMFERIHPTLNFEGTGVGLAIVRKAAERMRGKVGVESDGRSGSRFWVQLRAASQTA
jgi:light-regulated signal transduction histidine kinase (bacteriophytochrome)